MRSPSHNPCVMLCTALTLLALSGCASTGPAEPQPTARCPKPAPLPAAVSRIDLQPSTPSLSKALQWSETSEQLLRGETPK